MYDLFSLVGIISAVTGVGMLIVFVLALINGQLPLNYFGAFLAISPFVLLIIALILFNRRKI